MTASYKAGCVRDGRVVRRSRVRDCAACARRRQLDKSNRRGTYIIKSIPLYDNTVGAHGRWPGRMTHAGQRP